jgi:hypothetical protein
MGGRSCREAASLLQRAGGSSVRPGDAGRACQDRGATAVEAALLTPVFLLLVFGLIEGAWILFGDHVIRGSASSGVRTVSALANDADADFYGLDAAKDGIDAIGRQNLVRVVIYRANGWGDPPTAACRGGAATAGVCNVYDGTDLARPVSDFGCSGTSPDQFWCPVIRRTAVTGPQSPPDFIGVWVQARHRSFSTVVFGSERFVTAQAVLRVEPRTIE